jgi:hypothetical protein
MRETVLSFLDDCLARGSETAIMYIFDPDGGGRRSATARDAAHHVANAFKARLRRGRTTHLDARRARPRPAPIREIPPLLP